MNNYSWLQQKLHQLALSSKFMRETTFDVETSLISNRETNDNHVFVSGLARSGTTILLNAIYESNEFASLSYQDMPFVLAPNLWSRLSFNKQDSNLVERAHGDGIKVSIKSPEAFEEVFWKTFNECDESTKEKFHNYVRLVNQKYKKKRYLSKNNQNIRRLELISRIFPNSKILIPFRNPIQQAYSLLSQHQQFIESAKNDRFLSDYMRWIGHTEFGPNYMPIHNKNLIFEDNMDINHWLEQWLLTYQNCHEKFKDTKNIYFICYEQMCSSKDYWLDVSRLLRIKNKIDFKFIESQKEVTIDIDNGISGKGLSLYTELLQYRFRN